MNRNSTSSVGALHPVFFMLLVYVVSVLLAFFVCRMIYYSLHPDEAIADEKVERLEALTAAK
ncbi:MAG TPA: hypothetical protein VM871_01190 [Flavisolibacter sp.]|nr:hypothetical protein [Flavisolibacter sp.]